MCAPAGHMRQEDIGRSKKAKWLGLRCSQTQTLGLQKLVNKGTELRQGRQPAGAGAPISLTTQRPEGMARSCSPGLGARHGRKHAIKLGVQFP